MKREPEMDVNVDDSFASDVKACRTFAAQSLGMDVVTPEVTLTLYRAIGAPDELSATERQQVTKDIQTAARLAQEAFGTAGASADAAFDVFSIFLAEMEDEETDRVAAFQKAVGQAREIFGDEGVKMEVVMEIFDHLFVVEENEEDEEDDE